MVVNNITQINLDLCNIADKYTNSILYGVRYCPNNWDLLLAKELMITDYEFNIYDDIKCKAPVTLVCDCDSCYESALLFNNDFSEITIGINRASILNDESGTAVQVISDGTKVDGADPSTNADFRYIDIINLYTQANIKIPIVKVLYHTVGSVLTFEWLNTSIAIADQALIEGAISFNTIATGLIYDKKTIDSVLKGYSFIDNDDWTTAYSTSSGTNYIEAIESTLTFDTDNSKDQEGLRWYIETSGTILSTTASLLSNTNSHIVRLFTKRLKVGTIGVASNVYSVPFASDEVRLSYSFRDQYPTISFPTTVPSDSFVTGTDWYSNSGSSLSIIDGNTNILTGPSNLVSQAGLGAGTVEVQSYLTFDNPTIYCYQLALAEVPSILFEPGVAGNPTISLELDGIRFDDFGKLHMISIIRANNSSRTYTNLVTSVYDSSLTLLQTTTIANTNPGDFNRSSIQINNPRKGDTYTIVSTCTVDGSLTIRCEIKILISETY